MKYYQNLHYGNYSYNTNSAKECTKCHAAFPAAGYYSEQVAVDAEHTGYVQHLDAKGEGIVCEECFWREELQRETRDTYERRKKEL